MKILVVAFLSWMILDSFAICDKQTDTAKYDTVRIVKLNSPIYKTSRYSIIDLRDGSNFYEKIEVSNKGIRAATIVLPADIPQNFMVDTIKENKKGFDFSIEYGSRYFYSRQFFFTFITNDFYLTSVKTMWYDKKLNPDAEHRKTLTIHHPIPLAKFRVNDYISD